MLSTSTIEILKKLSPQELKRLGDFIKSPYHNTTTALEKIYETVLKAHPNYTPDMLDSKNMSEKIFGKGEFKEKRLKNLCSEFGDLLKKFIGQEELSNKKYEMDLYIAAGLYNKNLFDISKKFIKKSIAKNDDGPFIDSTKLFYHLEINRLQRDNFREFYDINKNEYQDTEFMISNSLIAGFIKDLYAEAYSALHDFPSGAKMSVLESFLEAFDANKFLESFKKSENKYYSYLKLNYLLYYFSKNDINDEQFYDLKNQIFEIIHNVKKWEGYTFIAKMISIILIKLIHLDTKYYRDLFDFGKLFCELKIFPNYSEDPMPVNELQSIFMCAIVLKEFDWAENFVVEYSQYLAEEFRENELNYSLGILSFQKGKFEESLNYLNKIKFRTIIQKIHKNFYLLMNYTELKSYESALSALQAIKQFNNDRKEIPEQVSTRMLQTLKYFHEIIRCEMDGKKIDGLIYGEAHSGKRFAYKDYILEKMEKLL